MIFQDLYAQDYMWIIHWGGLSMGVYGIYWKTAAEVYPFKIRYYSRSRALATDGEQLVQRDSEFTKFVSRQKLYRCD